MEDQLTTIRLMERIILLQDQQLNSQGGLDQKIKENIEEVNQALKNIEQQGERLEAMMQTLKEEIENIKLNMNNVQQNNELECDAGGRNQQHQDPAINQSIAEIIEDSDIGDDDVVVKIEPEDHGEQHVHQPSSSPVYVLDYDQIGDGDEQPRNELERADSSDTEVEDDFDEGQPEEGEGKKDWRQLFKPVKQVGKLVEFVWYIDLILCH